MMSIIRNIPEKIVTIAAFRRTLIKNVLAEHYSRKQVEHFKKHGCEVFEKDKKANGEKYKGVNLYEREAIFFCCRCIQ